MSSCIRVLGEVINPELLAHSCSPLILREQLNPDQPGVRIHRSSQMLVIKLDALDNHRRFPWLSPQVPGLTVICDYALVAPPQAADQPIRVLLLELKSGRIAGAAAQIANARLLLDWLLAVAAHHRGLDARRVEVRGIVLSDDVPGQRFEAKDLAERFRLARRTRQVPIVFLRRSRQSETNLSFEACFSS